MYRLYFLAIPYNSHATLLDSADKEHFHQHRKFYWAVLFKGMTMGVRGLGKMMDEIIGGHWIIHSGTEITKNWDRDSLGENDNEPRANVFKLLRRVG